MKRQSTGNPEEVCKMTVYLTHDTQYATIHTCPLLKGGTHGNHARTVLDAQRGGRPLQGVRRNCQEVYQTEETASGTIWRSIAYSRFRLAGVHQEAECQSIRINSFILSVAESTPVVVQAPSDDSCSATLLPFCHMAKEMARG
jgi:hypothetical protein